MRWHLGRDLKEGLQESQEAGGQGVMVRTLALTGTGDGRILSRGMTLASVLTVDSRAGTEAERPVGGGSCHDPGQRMCIFNQDNGEGCWEMQLESQSADRTDRCIWDAYGTAEKEEETVVGLEPMREGQRVGTAKSSRGTEKKKKDFVLCVGKSAESLNGG